MQYTVNITTIDLPVNTLDLVLFADINNQRH